MRVREAYQLLSVHEFLWAECLKRIEKGSALALKKIGCILADNLSPQKARILLMIALTRAQDPAELQQLFDL